MKSFLSCDWGVSSFRLRYVQDSGRRFDSIESPDKGIASTYGLWKQTGKDDNERFLFFWNVITDHVRQLEVRLKTSLTEIPLVISGMASSSIGMIGMDYKETPFKADGSDLHVLKIKRSRDFEHDIFIISGVKTNDDVMRGEETQLAGCKGVNDKKGLYIFPGTHSKHILVEKGNVARFKTFMTGEFFELLSKKSILNSSISREKEFSKKHKQAFASGVIEAQQSNILHSSFLVRTNQLFSKMDPGQNYFFLSGLLIGTELREYSTNKKMPITLVSSGELKKLYLSAFKVIGIKENVRSADSTAALIRGQLLILRNSDQ